MWDSTGGTPLSRAVINLNVAFQELGKKQSPSQ